MKIEKNKEFFNIRPLHKAVVKIKEREKRSIIVNLQGTFLGLVQSATLIPKGCALFFHGKGPTGLSSKTAWHRCLF